MFYNYLVNRSTAWHDLQIWRSYPNASCTDVARWVSPRNPGDACLHRHHGAPSRSTCHNDAYRVPRELGQVPRAARPGPTEQSIAAASFQNALAIDSPQTFQSRVLLVEVGALDPSKEDGHEDRCPVHSGLTVDQNVRPGSKGSEGRLFDILQGLITFRALVRHRARQLKAIPLCHAARTLRGGFLHSRCNQPDIVAAHPPRVFRQTSKVERPVAVSAPKDQCRRFRSSTVPRLCPTFTSGDIEHRIGDLVERPRRRRRSSLSSRWLRLLLDSHRRSPRAPGRGGRIHCGLTGRYRQYHRSGRHRLRRSRRRRLLREASPLQGRLVLLGRQARRRRRLRLRWRRGRSRQGCSSCPLAQSPNNLLSSRTGNNDFMMGIPGMSSDETRITLGFSDSNSSAATIASDHRSTADVVLISSQRTSGALDKNKAAASRSWWPCLCF